MTGDTWLQLEDGSYCHEESGEVIEIPEGVDRAIWLAEQFREAHDQEKAWTARKGMVASLYMSAVAERRCAYPDLGIVLSVRSSMRREQNTLAIRAILAECDLEAEDLLAAATAGKGWDLDLLTPSVRAIVEENTEEKPTRTWLAIDRIRKPAPTKGGAA
jgi:hypothetical protein